MCELDFVMYSFWVLFGSLLYIATVEIVLKHECYPVRPLLYRLPWLCNRTHWRLWPGLLPFRVTCTFPPSCLVPFTLGTKRWKTNYLFWGYMNEEPCLIFRWLEIIMVIFRQAISFSIKKDQWKGTKFLFFSFLQHRLEKSRKNWINWVHIILNTLRRYDAI